MAEGNVNEILSSVLGNEELMNKISGIVSSSRSESKEDVLPEVISAMASEINGKMAEDNRKVAEEMSKSEEKSADVSVFPSHSSKDSAALLKAIKPFLSKERCDLVDQLLKFEQLSELIKLTR